MRRVAALVAVVSMLGVGLLAAPAFAGTDTTPGSKAERWVRNQWWPDLRDSKQGREIGIGELSLREVECPAQVPWGLRKQGRALRSAVKRRARQTGAAEPAVSVDDQGFFACTASLDDQTLLVVGAINTKGDWIIDLASLLLVPKRLQGAVAKEYESQRDMKGTATCGSHSVIVTQRSVECEVQGASGAVVTATATLDADANLTDIAFSDASG